jgi:hypothetical protein
VPFSCRRSLVGRPIPLRHGLSRTVSRLPMADRIGVSTCRIGKRRRARWPLGAGSRAPSQQSRSSLLTCAPGRTSQPRASPCASRRFHQGFTGVQLGSNFSWHRFRVWLPTVLLRLRPVEDPGVTPYAPVVRKWAFDAGPVWYHSSVTQTLDLCDLVSHPAVK